MRALKIAAALTAILALSLTLSSAAQANKATFWKDLRSSRTQPAQIEWNGGSGAFLIRGLTSWEGWGKRLSRDDGRFRYNTCRPTCAEGRYRYTPARVTVKRLGRCNGQRRYKVLKVDTQRFGKGTWRFNCNGFATFAG